MHPGVDYTGVTVSFFCTDGVGNFVLHKRSANCRDERGTWDFGGGRLEFSEDFETGVLREIKEEYGCTAEILTQLPALSIVREHEGKPTHWVSIGFICQVDPQAVVLNEPRSMDAIAWFPFTALPDPLHTGAAFRLARQKHLFEASIPVTQAP